MINLLDNEDSINKIVGTYSSEDIRRYLKNPSTQTNQKHLRTISHSLYRSSGQYRSLINYFSKLYNMDYVIEGLPVADLTKVDKDKYKNTYYKYMKYIEKFNIKKNSVMLVLDIIVTVFIMVLADIPLMDSIFKI